MAGLSLTPKALLATGWLWRWRLFSLLLVVLLGLASRRSPGLAAHWAGNALGSLCYEISWVHLGSLFFRRASAGQLAAAVLVGTCGLEFLQLWQPPWLQLVRRMWRGRLVLGTTFVWFDFPAYFIGSGLAWYWLVQLRRWEQRAQARVRANQPVA